MAKQLVFFWLGHRQWFCSQSWAIVIAHILFSWMIYTHFIELISNLNSTNICFWTRAQNGCICHNCLIWIVCSLNEHCGSNLHWIKKVTHWSVADHQALVVHKEQVWTIFFMFAHLNWKSWCIFWTLMACGLIMSCSMLCHCGSILECSMLILSHLN